jgi:hypothetical protein
LTNEILPTITISFNKKFKQWHQTDKTMQTIFIFTHLIMTGAVSAVIYVVFTIEPKAAAENVSPAIVPASNRLFKLRALGHGMKEWIFLLPGNISRLTRW